ncbi:hypothetical protein [Agrobacterium sp. El2ro-1b]|uniref:hypothetical protein n=1 Tax=Agrobacterium sp. El2ro-1b TaxID=2969528 RepID=UPI003AAC03A3
MEKEKDASASAQAADGNHAALMKQLLQTAEESVCRLLSEENVQKIIELHLDNIGGLRVATVGCYHDKAVIYRDVGSSVPKQYPLNDIDFKMNSTVAPQVVNSAGVQQAIASLKKEGVIVNAQYDVKSGVVLVSIDYRGII